MFAIDTNLLVYAHNVDSEFHEKAFEFIEQTMNKRDETGKLSVMYLLKFLWNLCI